MTITQRIRLIACLAALIACKSGRDMLIAVSPDNLKVR